MRDRRMVDLFAGPGGLDVAARRLGISGIGIEWDSNACETRRKAALQTMQGDVRLFEPSKFKEATILAGGPPCQTYTVAGNGAGRRALDTVLGFARRMAGGEDVTSDLRMLADERTGLVLEPLRWALMALQAGHPYEAVILEQVPAVLPVWKAVGEILEGKGYSVACGVLRTEEYGVPQTRRRAILIARLVGKAILPAPTHRPYRKGVSRSKGDPKLSPWVAMDDVIERSEPFVVVSNYGTGGDPKARGRRYSTEPAATVTGKVSRNRVVSLNGAELNRFTHAEAGRLQTFPVDFPWAGRDIAQQIGNAVPPRLAIHVLAAALDIGGDVLDEALSETTTWRDPLWRESKVISAVEPRHLLSVTA
ncbi:DNA cytosine methyltransferase [Streptosporangium sp. NPDC020145]|uniref:DNA cytosine methyltransferase n=1 Tax=Streptosporangium sp. NPDC020145 TaxID=3154694 RepID=UPI0034339A5A